MSFLNEKERSRKMRHDYDENEDEDGKKEKKGVGSVVVAVDGDHNASHYALKWAVDRLLHHDISPHTAIVLLNVRQPYCLPPNSAAVVLERQPDDREIDLLRPFRGFCTRRQIQFEIVVVEDDDVAQALVDYSIRHRVQNLLMGAPSKKTGFSRLFNHRSGIARTVVKWVPNFCSVYIISKLGKLKNVRNANVPTPSIPPIHHTITNHILAVSTRGRGGLKPKGSTYGDDDDTASERETFEFGLFPSSGASTPSHDFDSRECRLLNQTTFLLTQKLELMGEDIKRLKLQHNQIPDMLLC